ncbi:hypothetical protein ACPZ19_21655 [Amycolatopsis lurida]
MSFKVDPDALRDFSTFLEDFTTDADEVKEYFEEQCELSVHQTGLLDAIVGGHAGVVEGMSSRTGLMSSTGMACASEVSGAAFLYSDKDAEEAKALDELDPGAKSKSDGGPSGGSSKASFVYEHFIWGDCKRPEDLEPKASEVEEWARTFLDTFSFTAQVRTVLNYACGFDPLEWLYEWWCGDWRAFAKCSITWGMCGEAVKQMAENFDPALNKLAEVWEGNAADAAADYFARFRDAVFTESEAFFGLEALYKLYMEALYEYHLITNNLINTAVDIVLDVLLMVGGGALVGVAAELMAIFNVVSKIANIVTALIDFLRLLETAYSQRPDIPACAIPQLEDRRGGGPSDHGYDHREVG